MSDIYRNIRVLGIVLLVASVATVSAQWYDSSGQGRGSAASAPPTNPGPTMPPKPSAPATGLVLGQVVDAGTGRPVPGAIVTMNVPNAVMVTQDGSGMSFSFNGPAGGSGMNYEIVGPGGNGARRVLTDGEGQFVFGSLPKGSFPISVTAPGYVPGSYGQRTVQGASRPLELDNGQQVGNATIKLWKYGSISGTVYDEAGEPLVAAQVRIVRLVQQGGRRQLQAMNQMQTDDQGRYRIGTLVPGNYMIAMPQSVTSVPATVADGFQELQQIDGELSNLYQRGLNESMAPYPNTSGVRVAGQYVQNMGNARFNGPQPSGDGRTYAYQTIFHPAATTSTDATIIQITSGLDRDGVDLLARPVPVFTVSGTLVGPDSPAGSMGVRLVPNTGDNVVDNSFETAVSVTDGTGAFVFPMVPAGQYLFRSAKVPRAQPQFQTASFTLPDGTRQTTTMNVNQNAALPTEPTLWADFPVSVSDSNVAGLQIFMRKGMRVSGRVVFEGPGTPPTPEMIQRIMINLSPVDGNLQNFPQQARVGADMQFTTMGFPPGRYIFNNVGMGNGWTLKTATLGGRNLDDDPLDLQNGDVGGVVLTFSTQFAQVSGSVHAMTNVGNTKDLDATVILFPADYRTWLDHGATQKRLRNTRAASDGTFVLSNMSPGSYLVVAIPSEALGDVRDAQFLDVLARSATRVTIGDAEKKTIDLSVSSIR